MATKKTTTTKPPKSTKTAIKRAAQPKADKQPKATTSDLPVEDVQLNVPEIMDEAQAPPATDDAANDTGGVEAADGDVTPQDAPTPDDAGQEAVSDDTGDDKPSDAADRATAIKRTYKGVVYELHPQPDGTFKLGDQVFKSLTAAAQYVLNVTGGVSGPRWWLGASTSGGGKGGTRLTPEEQAVRDAERALKAQARAMKAKAKAEEAARKAAVKAGEEARRAEVAFDAMIGLLMAAAREGRLTTAQVKTLEKLPV